MSPASAKVAPGALMNQAVMTSPGVIQFREVPVPPMGPRQLTAKIIRIGVCGSDIHVFHGKHPYTSYPVVQGHEVAATVVAVGPEVRGFAQGDRITIMPQVVCGTCYPCRTGRYHICDNLKVMGFQTTGTASDYFVVDADKCLVFPDTMSFEEGAMIEPLSVAVHALSRLDGGVAGKKIAVYGAGPIGNLVAQAAMGLGADSTLITDTSEHRLQLARECAITNAVNPVTEDLGAAIVRCFGPDKADAALECVGTGQSMATALAIARPGSTVGVVGAPHGVDVPFEANFWRGVGWQGSIAPARAYIPELLGDVLSGAIDPGRVFDYETDLDGIPGAYAAMDERRAIKSLIRVGSI